MFVSQIVTEVEEEGNESADDDYGEDDEEDEVRWPWIFSSWKNILDNKYFIQNSRVLRNEWILDAIATLASSHVSKIKCFLFADLFALLVVICLRYI